MFNYFENISKRISRTSFIFILVFIEIYFFVNGRAHFPDWDDTYGNLIMVYLIMVMIFLLWSGRETKEEINRPLHQSMGGFVGFFIATYFILFVITSLSGTVITPIAPELFWPTIIVQVCVVATSEELMFRGVLLEKFGVLISSAAFAIWHAAAYGVIFYMPEAITIDALVSILVAFFMGILLAYVAKKYGLASSISIHACYNLFVSGVFLTWGMM